MRILFMGTADLACPCLDRLIISPDYELAGVVTQPDRARGRSQKISSCPVRVFLGDAAMPVLTPIDVNAEESVMAIRKLEPDLIVVVAYGRILKARVLGLSRLGCINVHASLLPKYRGAAPVEWAIACGEVETGVTTMFINSEMDAGDIIAQSTEPIKPDDTAGSLLPRLARRGAGLLVQTLDMICRDAVRRIPQKHSEATYAPKLTKRDGRMDWSLDAMELNNKVRGFNPRPGCFFKRASGMTVRVLKTRVDSHALRQHEACPAGCVMEASGDGPLVLTGHQAIRLLELQPEGRNIMSGSSFLCGYSMKTGEQLL